APLCREVLAISEHPDQATSLGTTPSRRPQPNPRGFPSHPHSRRLVSVTVSTEGNFTLIDRALTRYCATIQKGSWSTSMPQLDLPVFNCESSGQPRARTDRAETMSLITVFSGD